MAASQYQIFRPATPGAERTPAEIFNGDESQIAAMKAMGQDLSYTLLSGGDGGPSDKSAAAVGPQNAPMPAGGGGGMPGGAGGASNPAAPAAAPGGAGAPAAMQGLMQAGQAPPITAVAGADGLRQGLATRRPPPLAGLLKAGMY